MSDNKTMERQQSKFIYDYLPWNTFNHAHNNLSGRISTLKHELDEYGQEVDLGLPKSYVISRIHRHISKWPNADAVRDDLTYTNTELVKPGWANYLVYPLTFECDTCGSVTQFDRDQMDAMAAEENDARALARCQNPECEDRQLSDRDQLPFVAICECGAIDELNVPDCCGVGMQFKRPTTQMSSWHWQCAINPGSCDTKSFYATPVYCPNGDCDNEDLEVLNHTSSSAFYPQVKNLINVQPQLDDLHSSEHYQAHIVSDYLLGDDGDEVDEHEKRRVANDILDGDFFDADREEVEEAMEEAEDRLMTDVQDHRDDTEEWLQGTYDGDATTLAEELYEFLSVVDSDYAPASGIESVSYQEMVDNNANDTHLSIPKVRKYNQLREDLNFSEVRLIKDFPITQVTYGYTRTAPNPPGQNRTPAGSDTETEGHEGDDGDAADSGGDDDDDDGSGDRPVELNLFNTGDYSAPQMFAQTNDAEAVLVQFDLEKVLTWLDENGLFDAPSGLPETVSMPDTDDPEVMRRWFVTNIDPPGRYDELNEDAPPGTPECISRHCYTLLNTTAHLFINGMGALAGHQRESLVEHLMPRTMSLVIYKRPDTDFALGSLWTLFEEQFDDFSSHLDELYDCSYDPVCIHDENGACEDCLYLAAISTENANHNLGRGTFYGGNFDGRDLIGYRDIEFDD